jgi:putative ATPase
MQPLAERLRPQSLDQYVGQQHLVGTSAPLRKAMEQGLLPSLILWGPPGVGKTTLALLIANHMNRPIQKLNAVHSGVKEVREAIDVAERQHFFQHKQSKPILFIDEIHRFSKSQQDSLLGAVEKGTITLIGATTENPSFEVIPALLSRCQVYVLEALGEPELELLLKNALENDPTLKAAELNVQERDALFRYAGGDARKLYNILELVRVRTPRLYR